MREPRRYLGLDLAGAKNQKTSMAALEYYPREKKTFLLDVHERITPHDEQSGDEAVLETLHELREGVVRMGVNVPIFLPSCITCTRRTCPLPKSCTVPSVKWMRGIVRKAKSQRAIRVTEFTPYTQRPIELWVRYMVLSKLPEASRFEIDETLGGNKAPLSARMHFLKRHIGNVVLTEIWPKLTVAVLASQLGLSRRTVTAYRNLEEGGHAREEILEGLAESRGIFIYDRDMRKLSQSLSSFDAFICAYTALLSDIGECTDVPHGFPIETGWVQYPQLEGRG